MNRCRKLKVEFGCVVSATVCGKNCELRLCCEVKRRTTRGRTGCPRRIIYYRYRADGRVVLQSPKARRQNRAKTARSNELQVGRKSISMVFSLLLSRSLTLVAATKRVLGCRRVSKFSELRPRDVGAAKNLKFPWGAISYASRVARRELPQTDAPYDQSERGRASQRLPAAPDRASVPCQDPAVA
jgi:hypothetical protein